MRIDPCAAITNAFRASLINIDLYKNISTEFDDIEDAVKQYCYLNSTAIEIKGTDRIEALDKNFQAHTNILNHAKKSQESIF